MSQKLDVSVTAECSAKAKHDETNTVGGGERPNVDKHNLKTSEHDQGCGKGCTSCPFAKGLNLNFGEPHV